MHGHVNQEEFLQGIAGFLGSYYLLLAAMNGIAAFYLWQSGRARTYFRILGAPFTSAHVWLLASLFFVLIAPIAMSGDPTAMRYVSFPQGLRDGMDRLMGPVVYSVGTLVILAIVFVARKFFVKPMVAWGTLNLALLWMGYSMTDPNFAEIVTKADNVPIVGLVFLLGFFTWLAGAKAVENDERAKQGLPPLEKLDNEKVLVWPDLVYTELVCMVALTALLLLWGIGL